MDATDLIMIEYACEQSKRRRSAAQRCHAIESDQDELEKNTKPKITRLKNLNHFGSKLQEL